MVLQLNSNAENREKVRKTDLSLGAVHEVEFHELPVCCPLPQHELWSAHPRIYLPLKVAGDEEACPYCGARFRLKAQGSS